MVNLNSNRLIFEKSPYLLQHSANPVNWYPWGDEAFETAMAEDKPVFLSIGYSACHWCHVMAHESFEDKQVADILNRAFISIKVDREERPDVDSIYMEACRLMTGGGGWPLSVFLTPDQKPFYAGTYYPKRTTYGRPGFIELLEVIEREWKANRKAILKNADILLKELNKEERGSPFHAFNDVINTQLSYLKHTYDDVYGGFGGAPKFPMPSNLIFLSELSKKRKDVTASKMLYTTLDAMYKGGIYDHIGGGFARYSTDREWLVPHFEKMLYDNAQLIKVYAEAYKQSGKGVYKEIVNDCVKYLADEMKGLEGGFYSAQDADSQGVEGLYYLFTPQEVVEILGEQEGRRFCEAYGITEKGNFEGKNIPNLIGEAQELVTSEYKNTKEKLYRFRKQRMNLHTDDKYLSFWNALLADCLASAYKNTMDNGLLILAKDAFTFIKRNLTDGKKVYTSYKDGVRSKVSVLDDAAAYIAACISLYGATFDEEYLKEAYAFTDAVVADFWDDEKGGFYLTSGSGEKLITRPKEFYDGVTPSGNSMMYLNVLYLQELEETNLGAVKAGIRDRLGKFLEKTGSAAAQGYYAYAKLKEEHFSKLMCILPEDMDKQSFIDDHKEALFGYDAVVFVRPSETYRLLGGLATFYACREGKCKAPGNILPVIE